MQMARSTFARFAFFTVALTFVSVAPDADAGHWMYRRSYFSHAVPENDPLAPPPPAIRYAHRPAYISGQPGYHVRGGYRYNRVHINAGSGADVTVTYDEWFRNGP